MEMAGSFPKNIMCNEKYRFIQIADGKKETTIDAAFVGSPNQSVQPTTRNEPYPDRFKLGKWLSKELLRLLRDKVKALTP